MSSSRSRAEVARIEADATDWVARRDAGLDESGQRQLDAWLAADPDHATAFARFDSAWGKLDRATGETTAPLVMLGLNRAARRRRQVRRAWAGATATCVLLVAGAWQYRKVTTREPGVVAVASPSAQTLPDGSVVEFNRGAEIALDFRPDVRRVRLVRGEAHFQVTHDVSRPFIVSAGQVEVKAVGTAFAVRYGQRDVQVLVTEGRVNVAEPASAASLVGAGERVTMAVGHTGIAPSPIAMTEQDYREGLGWRGTRLDFSGTPLAEAIKQFNTHNLVHLVLADDRVGALEVSGLFRADNVEGFVRLLESSFGLKAERRSPHEIILRSAN